MSPQPHDYDRQVTEVRLYRPRWFKVLTWVVGIAMAALFALELMP